MIGGCLQTVDQLMELVWAGFLSFLAIASIGVAQGWVQLFNTARMGIDTAVRASISRAVGANDLPLATHIATQSLVLNLALSTTLMIIGVTFSEYFLRVLGVSDELIEVGGGYMKFRFVSTTSFAFLFATSSILQASGDSITPMKAVALGRIIDLFLSPTLIFGLLWFPSLGLPGAAISASIGQFTGFAFAFRALFTGKSRLRLSMKDVPPDFPLWGRLLRIGIPAAVTSGERSLAQLILVGIVAPFGDVSLTAYALSQRVQMFIGLGQQGVGQAAGVLVGQNLGAKQLFRAKATTWWALCFTSAISLLIGGAILAFPSLFLSIFTRDQHVLDVAVRWLQIMVFGFIAMGVGNVFMQVFNTAGDTLAPMLVTLGSIWGVQQPGAIILSSATESVSILGLQVPVPAPGLGEFGIAWAVILAMIARLFVYFPYFLWAPWWSKRVN